MSVQTPFRIALGALLALSPQGFTFTGFDGTPLDLKHWRGQPVLVVNRPALR